MRFDVTPEEAQPCAHQLVRHLVASKRSPVVEKAAWDDVAYRTTVFTRAGDEVTLYEVQGQIDFHDQLRGFAQWLAAKRKYAELWIVAEGAAAMTALTMRTLTQYGVGLLLRDEKGQFIVTLVPRNPVLQVTPDPGLKYGDAKQEVWSCVEKFNAGARKDALRDLFELVERETEKTLTVASRKQWLGVPVPAVQAQDWSGQINTLASSTAVTGGRKALIDSKLRDDLHSFRGARNLLDHKVMSRKQEQRRQCQMTERMMMGARLMSELIALRRRIR